MQNKRPMPRVPEPQASRLTLPSGYQHPTGAAGLLPWTYVVERLEQALTYWLATTRPDGRPHVTPVWGVWVETAFYFNGIPTARWSQNLTTNPAAALHLESGTAVVILDGLVEDVVTDGATATRIVDVWDGKYGRLQPAPASEGIFRLRPRRARAWTQFPEDATCWRFPLP